MPSDKSLELVRSAFVDVAGANNFKLADLEQLKDLESTWKQAFKIICIERIFLHWAW